MSKSVPTVRVGVIGIGFGQRAHVPAFSSIPGCEVEAICASDRQRASRVAERLGIGKAYGNWENLIEDPLIDAVSVATPPALQADIAVAAMSRGKAVFCEKPLALSKSDAERMAALAQETSVANMVDFELPEIETWRKAKSMLDENSIGVLRQAAVNWYVETYTNKMGLRSWKTSIEAGGGTLNGFVSHVFHYLQWFAGPVEELSACLSRSPGDTRTGDTLVTLNLKLAPGIPVTVSVCSSAFLGTGHQVIFYGNEGTLMLDNRTADYARGFRLLYGTRQSDRLEEVEVAKNTGGPDEDGRVALVSSIAGRFVNWIREGVPAGPDFSDGHRVQALIDAARRSHEMGCWIRAPF